MKRGLLAVLACAAVIHARGAELRETVVYQAGQGPYHTYRIPAVIETPKGALLAFAEGRKEGQGDAGNIDLIVRRSNDGGATWGEMKVLWDDGANTCGNPCPVVDDTTGAILLLMTHNLGHDKEGAIIRGESESTRTVWMMKSDDDGHTWTAPQEITQSTKDPSWGWYATGPGVGIQLKHGPHVGRLVVPCDHSYPDAEHSIGEGGFGFGSHVIYSDDHGETWHLGGVVRPFVNECQVVELSAPSGAMLLNMRAYFRRQLRSVARSADGGATWSNPVDDKALIEPVCQAGLVRVAWPQSGTPGKLLFTNPASLKRENMTARLSMDDGATWSHARSVYTGPSAYSCPIDLGDEMGCLYERGEKHPYESIVFARFDEAWVVNR
ncbi:MAG: hypothetical protein AMXMBFR84_30240 [Candidatus Hydrogenedentota bacterium]